MRANDFELNISFGSYCLVAGDRMLFKRIIFFRSPPPWESPKSRSILDEKK